MADSVPVAPAAVAGGGGASAASATSSAVPAFPANLRGKRVPVRWGAHDDDDDDGLFEPVHKGAPAADLDDPFRRADLGAASFDQTFRSVGAAARPRPGAELDAVEPLGKSVSLSAASASRPHSADDWVALDSVHLLEPVVDVPAMPGAPFLPLASHLCVPHTGVPEVLAALSSILVAMQVTGVFRARDCKAECFLGAPTSCVRFAVEVMRAAAGPLVVEFRREHGDRGLFDAAFLLASARLVAHGVEVAARLPALMDALSVVDEKERVGKAAPAAPTVASEADAEAALARFVMAGLLDARDATFLLGHPVAIDPLRAPLLRGERSAPVDSSSSSSAASASASDPSFFLVPSPEALTLTRELSSASTSTLAMPVSGAATEGGADATDDGRSDNDDDEASVADALEFPTSMVQSRYTDEFMEGLRMFAHSLPRGAESILRTDAVDSIAASVERIAHGAQAAIVSIRFLADLVEASPAALAVLRNPARFSGLNAKLASLALGSTGREHSSGARRGEDRFSLVPDLLASAPRERVEGPALQKAAARLLTALGTR